MDDTNDLNIEVAKCVSVLMEKNSVDWNKRYKDYLEDVHKKCKIIKLFKRMIHVESPLTLYSSISQIEKNVSSNSVSYDVRVWGHSIGKIVINLKNNKNEICEILNKDSLSTQDVKKLKEIKKNGTLNFVIEEDEYDSKCNTFKVLIKYLNEKSSQENLENWVKNNLPCRRKYSLCWNSKEMTQMRKIFQDAYKHKAIEIDSEHSCENLLLKVLAEKNGSRKYIKSIQPIKLADCLFFQMPTCLAGSKLKQIKTINNLKNVDYSGSSGGGIDILAKLKLGNKIELCVIELKDEYKKDENPRIAIRQAIAYAVCLDYVLRSPEINTDELNWYKELTKSNGKIKNNITINVVVAMPYADGSDSINNISLQDAELAGKHLQIKVFDHIDTLELHYLFFKKDALIQNKIEDGIITSLFEKLKRN